VRRKARVGAPTSPWRGESLPRTPIRGRREAAGEGEAAPAVTPARVPPGGGPAAPRPAPDPDPGEGGPVNDVAGQETGQIGRAPLHSNAHAPRPILLAAGAFSDTGIVYWVPFPRACGARRG
jgi:hypothetical protein